MRDILIDRVVVPAQRVFPRAKSIFMSEENLKLTRLLVNLNLRLQSLLFAEGEPLMVNKSEGQDMHAADGDGKHGWAERL